MKLRASRRDHTDPLHALLPLIPTPWSAEEFIRQVSGSRQRPIHLLPYPLTTSDPTGYWIPTAATDYIVVPDTATGARRDAIIGHELAHILLGHEPQVSNRFSRTCPARAQLATGTCWAVPAQARLRGGHRTRGRDPGNTTHRLSRDPFP